MTKLDQFFPPPVATIDSKNSKRYGYFVKVQYKNRFRVVLSLLWVPIGASTGQGVLSMTGVKMNITSSNGKSMSALTITFPQRTAKRLDVLQELTDAGSHSEVIRNALIVYEVAVKAAMRGSALCELTRSQELNVLPLTFDVDIQGETAPATNTVVAAGARTREPQAPPMVKRTEAA